jgi:uncharacterized protein YcbK (DUF882 family)
MNRRTFLIGSIATLFATPETLLAKVDPTPRHLFLHHTHTDETLEVVYRPEVGIPRKTQRRLEHFLRDYRTDEVAHIDQHLFNILSELKRRARNPDGVFEIISAYRSPRTNSDMRRSSKGVARRSLHMEGRALDVRLRGTPTTTLRDLALNLKRGGVGYYRRSNFVHVDTGPVRSW